MPSEITEDFWLSATSPAVESKDTLRSGKWLLFTPSADHDGVWVKIREATEAGALGCSAKATTARQNRLQARPGALLTCVYTQDYEDHKDVRRVLSALRMLGFGGRLSYKADIDTLSGVYGKGAAIYVSQPGSSDFNDRRRQS